MRKEIKKFEDVRDKILEALSKNPNFKEEVGEDFVLVDSFINTSLADVEGEIVIGGSVLPTVMVIERPTGKVHFFAFKALDIKHNQDKESSKECCCKCECRKDK